MDTAAPSAHRINLDWLFRLRWGAVLGQIVTILIARFGFDIELPLPALGAVVGAEVLVNVAVKAWSRRSPAIGPAAMFAGLAFDVLALTALLLMSGGPHNPFSFLYLVYIALAAVVLAPRWTWSLVALAAVGSASLFVLPSHHLHIHGDDGGLFNLHLQGMWVAFTVAATFIVYFVMRVRRALATRETELQNIRASAERHERLSALATLAAGAAHELATPLGTIATVAKELERALAGHPNPDLVEDARLVRSQVERCRRVLQQLSADTGATMADDFERLSLRAVLDETVAELQGQGGRIVTRWQAGAEDLCIKSPRAPLRQALSNLIKNAWDACVAAGLPPEAEVEAHAQPDGVRVLVRDAGVGMEPAVVARAGEPFFTTKATGKGMGLGLFVARSVAERLGGRLAIQSHPRRGTTVELRLPTASPEATRA